MAVIEIRCPYCVGTDIVVGLVINILEFGFSIENISSYCRTLAKELVYFMV